MKKSLYSASQKRGLGKVARTPETKSRARSRLKGIVLSVPIGSKNAIRFRGGNGPGVEKKG